MLWRSGYCLQSVHQLLERAYCYVVIYTFIQHHNETIIKTHEGRKTQEELRCRKKRHKKTSLEKYSPLTLLQGFERLACERMLEIEHKLHILTPLLWPSRCVFIVLLMLGSTPSGLSEGPLALVWLSLPHLVSNPLGVCWQLLRGFSECPLGRVWPSLPHLVSRCLDFNWQLHRGFPRSPSVGCGLPYHISSLTLWESAGNCSRAPNSTELNNNSTPTRSPTGSLNRMFNRH